MIIKNGRVRRKFLVFLDIDGTLVDSSQKTNSNALPRIIREMSRKGVLFGLNSNRSYNDIIGIYKKFCLNGPIILENGVYFKKTLLAAKTFFVLNPQRLNVLSRKAVEKFIKGQNLDCSLLVGNTVKLIKSNGLTSFPFVILLNKFREYTGSVYIYRYGKIDAYLSKKLVSFLRVYFRYNKLNLLVESPKSFGNVIFWPKGIDKGKAFKEIKKYYRGYQFVMVGDDLADLKTLPEVEYFFAVKNAQKSVKQMADYVSKGEYTEGVVEILQHLQDIS
ncbi:MAG: HAD family hydrolase [Candidatus Moraniibacteriota bacterium]